ncbi:hypothetical protein JCM8547_001976 [Rhodosporidiobolus lusitaniae]
MKASSPSHGYPTPPHSPDFDSPASTPPSPSQSPDLASRPPSHSHSARPSTSTATVDTFDPLDGYARPSSHHVRTESPDEMSTAREGGAARSGSTPASATTNRGGRRRSTAGVGDEDYGQGESGEARMRTSASRRRGSTSTLGGAAGGGGGQYSDKDRRKAKMQPPKDRELFDTDEEWQEHHEQEQQSGWHHLPLVLVALPPLGAIVHGRAENWADAILLLLVCFYLYQLIKVPWEIYYLSHVRRVLPSSPSPSSPSSPSFTDPLSSSRLTSTEALRRAELSSLLFTFLVPALGASLLHYVKGLLSDPERYINRMTVGLFVVASGVRPLLRVVKLLKRNSLYHQTLVHHPSSEVYQLRRRVEALEADLASLTQTLASKSDLRTLRTGLDAPLTTLSKAVRRFARQESYSRLTTEERFSAILETMQGVVEREEEREEELEELRRRVQEGEERGAGLGRVVMGVVREVVWHLAARRHQHGEGGGGGKRGWMERGLAWYVFWPVNVPRAAIGWGVEKAVEVVGVPEGVGRERGHGGRLEGGKRRRTVGAGAARGSNGTAIRGVTAAGGELHGA